jgi:hypothetical protein
MAAEAREAIVAPKKLFTDAEFLTGTVPVPEGTGRGIVAEASGRATTLPVPPYPPSATKSLVRSSAETNDALLRLVTVIAVPDGKSARVLDHCRNR